MKVTDENRSNDVADELKQLNSYSLEIGVFGADDSFIAMLASVHEFGMTIRPKGKFLTIPTKAAGKKKARDIKGLFKPKGKRILATTNKQGKLTVMFYLVEEVVIPERSFIRSTFDEKENEWANYISTLIGKVVNGSATAREVYERLGARIQRDIQRKIKQLSEPGNAGATVARKGSNNPLIDSGRLRQSVTWKVVSI